MNASATKTTPGPWKVVAEPNGIEYTLIAKTPGKETERTSKFFVALFYGDAGSGDTKANAQLCASAPELLEKLKNAAIALKFYEQWINKLTPKEDYPFGIISEQEARNTIAQAEGR